jgi:F-type H+-transporting ATPase subunit b
MIEFIYEPETWVAVAFVIFLGVLVRFGVPNLITKSLDDRSSRIQAELDEAARLRKEAEGIIASARAEAERLATEAKTKAEEFVARRTKMAETRIAQAEAHALAEVRAAAADAAVTAAEKVLSDVTRGAAADALIAKGISDLKAKLN